MSDYKQTRDAAREVTSQYDKMLRSLDDDLVQAAVERGFWLGRSCGGSKAEIDAALAAIREGVEND